MTHYRFLKAVEHLRDCC